MANILQAITSKADWTKKILDPKITEKYVQELQNQHCSFPVVQTAIKLLQCMSHPEMFGGGRDMDAYLFPFNWDIFRNKCTCDCLICDPDSSISHIVEKQGLDNQGFSTQGPRNGEPNDEDLITSQLLTCECLLKFESERKKFLNDLVRKNSSLIDDSLRERLMHEVELLEQMPVDWHPNSNDQVRDLIHPSLYCYVDGVSRTNNTADKMADLPKASEKPGILQWLPAEISLNDGIDKPRFTSEICGHPRNTDSEGIYRVIEEILGKFAPLLKECCERYLKGSAKADKTKTQNNNNSKKWQVIVKMANTVLTPDKPEFPGGSWHLEGHKEEHIVATGIYYYHNENIVDSGLYTAIPVTEDHEQALEYGQNQFEGIPRHYGLKPEAEQEGVQHLGPVTTNENDCIVFPNFVRHKVSKFRLLDPSRPGVRKILLFWLVDPNKRILSTADVAKPDYGLEDAKAYRELLMYHRKNGVDVREEVFSHGLSLCEH
jgi:hypothetical protein